MKSKIGKAFEQKLKEIKVNSIRIWIDQQKNPQATTLPCLFTPHTMASAHTVEDQGIDVAEHIQTIQAYPCLEIVFNYIQAANKEVLILKIIQLPVQEGLSLLTHPNNLSDSAGLSFFIAVDAASETTKQAVIQWLQTFSPKQRNQLLQGLRFFDVLITLPGSPMTTVILDAFTALNPTDLQKLFEEQALASQSNLEIFLKKVPYEHLITPVLTRFIQHIRVTDLLHLVTMIENSSNEIAQRVALENKKSRVYFRDNLRKRGDTPAQALLLGLSLLELIENPSLPADMLQQISIATFQPALSLPWLRKRSLLHLATLQQHPTIIPWLLSQGLDPNLPDADQQSPWQIALQQNHPEILCYFAKDPRIKLHSDPSQGVSPLQQCISQHHFPLTQALSTSMATRVDDSDVIDAVSQTLSTYTPPLLTQRQIESLTDTLADTNAPPHNRALRDCLTQYSAQEQDSLCCFILMVTSIHSQLPASRLEQAAYDFLRRQCEVLANAPSDQRERKTAQMAILFYLFSLPHTFSLCMIKTLRVTLTAQQQTHFDTLLCFALAQPRIYQSFDLTLHRSFHAQLPVASPALASLFETYLLNAELSLLPVPLLLEIAHTYNNEQLVNLLRERPSGIIAVLIHNCLNYQAPMPPQALLDITQIIQAQIHLFHTPRPNKPLSHLRMMLELAQIPATKHLIQTASQSLSATPHFLNQHIHKLLQESTQDSPLSTGSLLYDITLSILQETLKAGYPRQAEHTWIRLFHQLSSTDALQLIQDAHTKLTELNPLWAKAICDSTQADATIFLWFEQQCTQLAFVPLIHFLPHMPQLKSRLQGKTIAKLCQRLEQCISSPMSPTQVSSLIALRLFMIVLEYPNAQRCEQLGRMLSLFKKHTPQFSGTDLSLWIETFQDSLMDSHKPVPERRLALQLLTQILSKQTREQLLDWLKTCPATWQEALFGHALAGLHSSHLHYANACERLTQLYCQYFFFLAEPIQSMVQRYMGQQDLAFLSDMQLQHIAAQVLQPLEQLEASTYQGIWIQRLLTSPRFIAACSGSAAIDKLVARYQQISQILKQDELVHLTQYIIKMPHAKEHHLALQHLPDARLADPKRQAHLLAKRDRLMQFVVKDAIRGLFNQLEDACIELRQQGNAEEITIANKALQVFYTYHGEKIAALRNDFLFRIADNLYGYALAPHGDLTIANNPLLHWLNKHLPHRSFQIEELERRLEVKLYNLQGQEIGFIDEFNQAITFINHEPTPLIKAPDMSEGMVLYNSQQRKIGTLSADSHVVSDNLFRHATIAMILGQLPHNTLTLSPAGLRLLMEDILRNNTLSLVYQCEAMQNNHEKRQWFEQTLTQHITHTRQALSPAIVESLTTHQTPAQLTHFLTHTKQAVNRLAVFKNMLAHDNTRAELFKTNFETFLSHANIQTFLTLYFAAYKEPWFAEGLRCFTHCSRQTFSAHVFQKGLFQYYHGLKAHGEKHAKTEIHALLQSFSSNDAMAQCLLDILAIPKHTDVQTLTMQHTYPLLRYFEKKHLVAGLQVLNRTPAPTDLMSLYQLSLLILEHNYTQLFPPEELRYAVDMVWQSADLDVLSLFLSLHRSTHTPLDNQNQLADKLFNTILPRCANFGRWQLFYTANNQLEEKLVVLPIQPPCHQPANPPIKNPKKSPAQEQAWNQLRTQKGTMHWPTMLGESWQNMTPQRPLPAITVFLIHYTGPSLPVQRLLQDCLHHATLINNKAALQSVSGILERFPQRDISQLIFASLVSTIQKNPNLLDATLWRHLNQYYQLHYPQPQGARSFNQEISLLQYFGQKKAYPVIQRAYAIMQDPLAASKPTARAWQQFFIATQIEQRLQNHLQQWYFPILAFILRLRHRTFTLLKKGVQRCELPVQWQEPTLPKVVKINVVGGAVIEKEIQTIPLTQSLKKNYEQFLNNETRRKLKRNQKTVVTTAPVLSEETQESLTF